MVWLCRIFQTINQTAISVDNLFLFLVVFSSFGINSEYQRRILNYGIVGAIILRLIFVLLGVSIINVFHWVLYLFGAILIVSGIKIIFKGEGNENFKESKIIKWVNKIIPITDTLEGNKFFIKKDKVLYATPLFAVLLIVEFTDVIFAIDSIPAIFSITIDPFIVYTSNIFAIMGLRSMYFVLSNMQEKFKYMKYGVSLVLIFTGIKLLILYFNIKIPIELSLGIIFFILIISIFASIAITKKAKLQNI